MNNDIENQLVITEINDTATLSSDENQQKLEQKRGQSETKLLELTIDGLKDKCPICMEEIESEKNRVITDCGHAFHCSCLMQNAAYNGFGCPYCRSTMAIEPLEEDDESDETESFEDDWETTDDEEDEHHYYHGPNRPHCVNCSLPHCLYCQKQRQMRQIRRIQAMKANEPLFSTEPIKINMIKLFNTVGSDVNLYSYWYL